ncbi:1,3-beta-glucan synthase regulator [Bacillus mycoides]|uniref:SMI1/KNR4 family protein n=1 Tax=Bacillus mycoides TaxID=1405 RepID=UPI000BF6707B|nr:SMI1/KNR4 family protein [Bacillus mycoides]MED1383653.1 SMI1/KNR4 family protein [Bacillus mycoides]PFX95666.1 1,3-beta-glucan synthase regulator [Bacillus mycoides]QWH79083.1 SMI1/KNR4 family protein [Bacillus mycoides]QWI44131.1 SMI1/KNR4 family protein [Bacillus mycoides]
MINLFNIPDLIEKSAASDIEIQAVENRMNVTLPNVYKELLRCTNGFSIGGGLLIYGTEHIAERNEVWEVDEYARGYVSIGDDGGGNVFLMAQHAEEKEVVVIDSGDMNPSHATVITADFKKWVNSGCVGEIEQKTIHKSSDICNIVLVKTPSEGLKDLIRIKNVLGLEIAAVDLLKGSKNLPYILVERFPYGKAKKLIEKLAIDSTILRIEATGKNS